MPAVLAPGDLKAKRPPGLYLRNRGRYRHYQLIDTNDVHIACLPRFGIAAQRMLDMGITPTAVLTETGDVWSIFQK